MIPPPMLPPQPPVVQQQEQAQAPVPVPVPMPVSHISHASHAHAAIGNVNVNVDVNDPRQMGPRSISMPNMNMSLMDKANDEEAKRLKRLARNRASARLRRLRKKNLVSTALYYIDIVYMNMSCTILFDLDYA